MWVCPVDFRIPLALKMQSAVVLVLAVCLAQVAQIAAVGECVDSIVPSISATDECAGRGNCTDAGYYGLFTCNCAEGYTGNTCEAEYRDVLCEHGNVVSFNQIIESNGYPTPLPNRFTCVFRINIHGATVVNITVLDFDFESAKDELGVGLTPIIFEDYTIYDNQNRLVDQQFPNNIWMGIFTDKNIQSGGYRLQINADGDDCLSVQTPCMNGGTCIDVWQNYTCECPTGFDGYYCEIDVDFCRTDPCLNGGTCNTVENGYTCTCPPSFTGSDCETGVVIVASTVPFVNAQFQVLEGVSVQSLNFDLTFSPSSLANYAIGGSSESGLWQVSAWLSQVNGMGSQLGATTPSLSAGQQRTIWDPPTATTIGNINAPALNVGTGVLCSSLQYFCARLDKGPNPSTPFELIGEPTDDSLFGCTTIVCRGVEISGSSLSITSGDLTEGNAGQSVNFDFSMTSAADAGSVSGTNLWQFTAFGSQNAAGTGTQIFTTNIAPSAAHGSTGVTAGSSVQFTGLSFDLSLAGSTSCDDFSYICVTASKGPSASPDFTLSGVPNDGVFTACQMITCRGVLITSASLIATGQVLEGTNQNVPLGVTFTSDPNYGTALGNALWKITAYANANSDGSGNRYNQQLLTLSSSQASTTLNAGSTVTIGGLSYSLNLLNGPTCSQFGYVCVDVEQGDNPSPHFDLSPTTTTTCTPVTCRGVEISGSSVSVTSGDLQEGEAGQSVVFNFNMNSVTSAGSVSGSNLWQFTAFGSQNSDGSGLQTSSSSITVNDAQGSVGVNAGSTAQISGLNFQLDLSGNTNCDDVQYICVTAARGPRPSVDFTLTGIPDSSVFTACEAVTCRGVEITSSALGVSGAINAGQNNNVGLSVSLTSNVNAGTAVGSGLWKVSAFVSVNSDGSGTRYDESSLNLNSAQSGTALSAGSTASINDLTYSLDLRDGPACANFRYICVEVEKGDAPFPDYGLSPTTTTACTAVDCSGVEISQTSISITSGGLREGQSGQTVSLNFNMVSVANTGSVSGTNLWQFTAFGSQNADGSGAQTSSYPIALSSSQGNVPVNAGQTSQFTGLSFNVDLSGDVNCADVPYICVTVDKGLSPNPNFQFSGVPDAGVLTACQDVACRGVEITSAAIDVSLYVSEGEDNNVGFSISLQSNGNGGTAVGDGLWKVTGYASNDANGNGVRYDENSVTLSSSQAGTTLNAGSLTNIFGLNYDLDLRNGPTCSQFGFICVEVEKGDSPSPDFDLSPAVTRACTPVECRSVYIDSISISLDSAEVFHGQANDVIFDLTAVANPNYGSISGNNLWIITTWLSNNQGGSGPTLERDLILRSDLSSLPVNSGSPSIFMDLVYSIDLTSTPTCRDFSYICASISMNPGSSVDFTLTGNTDTCIPITCTDINECGSAPCNNGGTCTDFVNRYTCDCPPGFTGTHCQININECASNPCQNGGTCFDRTNHYVCQCMPGYTGTDCDINIDECASNPCANGATCTDRVNAYICTCLSGFTGPLCAINIDECASSPCQNGGSCTDYVNFYQCACIPGFTGVNCAININECASVPCQNGGTCTDGINGFTCRCQPGFTGTFCGTDINECASNPCSQGNCIDRVNAYECVCFAGYTGVNCDININECVSTPCQNGGQCIDGVNGYRCNCVAGYTGDHCQTDINECLSGPCRNGGSCEDRVNAFNCNCQPGYTGVYCETNINECISGPCGNGGTCTDGVNRYTCQCLPGFTGTYCQINIDECASSPCVNGGTCLDEVNMFTCQCTAEWTGLRCEISLDACRSSPCQNGGTCVNAGINYVCECNPGYAGYNCEIDINECASLPCQNGGRCINGIAMFTCQCPQGFSGTWCQDVGYCDLEGEWYNECNDKITISRTSTGMILGDYQSSVALLTGYSPPTVVVGYANQNCNFPSFGFVVTRDNGKSTTSWSGQCHLCGGEEVLYTTWTNTERVTKCSEVKQATLIGQDKFTRYQQSQAPRQDP